MPKSLDVVKLGQHNFKALVGRQNRKVQNMHAKTEEAPVAITGLIAMAVTVVTWALYHKTFRSLSGIRV